MDCQEAQKTVLEGLDRALPAHEEQDLDLHLSVCAGCARFARVQRAIDRDLSGALSAPRLSTGFRASVSIQTSRREQSLWPYWLPDLAYLAGSVVAIGLCAVVLPFPVVATLSTGAGVAVASFFLQTELAGALAELEEAGE